MDYQNQRPKHFFELDGLRGVALISVILFHQPWVFWGQNIFGPGFHLFPGHAYLAVDFFFLLSGFVLEHAYGKRLAQPGNMLPVLRDRVIRLHPMIALGTLLGAISILITDPMHGFVHLPLRIAVSLVPMPGPASCGGLNCLVDQPLWSLCMEVVANIVFILIAQRLSNGVLVAITLFCAAAMIWMCFTIGDFDVAIHNYGPIRGLARVGLSFAYGILLYRLNHRWGGMPTIRHYWIAPVLFATFVVLPYHHPASRFYDPVIVLIVYPIMLIAAARSRPIVEKVARWSGDISYPVYVLHIPVLVLLSHYAVAAGLSMTRTVMIACLLAMVAISHAALKLYDEPVRSLLRRRFGSRRHRTPIRPPAPVTDMAA